MSKRTAKIWAQRRAEEKRFYRLFGGLIDLLGGRSFLSAYLYCRLEDKPK